MVHAVAAPSAPKDLQFCTQTNASEAGNASEADSKLTYGFEFVVVDDVERSIKPPAIDAWAPINLQVLRMACELAERTGDTAALAQHSVELAKRLVASAHLNIHWEQMRLWTAQWQQWQQLREQQKLRG